MIIDSHCHLNHPRLAEIGGAEAAVKNAVENGVQAMLTICCRVSDEFPEVLATAKKFNNVWCTVGTHPHDAGKEGEKAVTQEQLVKLALSDSNIIGIGETGLDYYYDNSPHDDQEKSFRKHIRACIEADMPMVVHARDADDDIARIMKEEGQGTRLKGVMHCFSSGRGLAEAALGMGFYISFSGILTFKQADELRAIAKDVPLDRLLVETDAPFLAPVPHRGQINQPAYVLHTLKALANLHKLDEENMISYCNNNFFRLFNRASL